MWFWQSINKSIYQWRYFSKFSMYLVWFISAECGLGVPVSNDQNMKFSIRDSFAIHCVKSVQIRSIFSPIFSPNTGKYGPEITPYLDIFTKKSSGNRGFVPISQRNSLWKLHLCSCNSPANKNRYKKYTMLHTQEYNLLSGEHITSNGLNPN